MIKLRWYPSDGLTFPRLSQWFDESRGMNLVVNTMTTKITISAVTRETDISDCGQGQPVQFIVATANHEDYYSKLKQTMWKN